jgi:hypothetical protein
VYIFTKPNGGRGEVSIREKIKCEKRIKKRERKSNNQKEKKNVAKEQSAQLQS